MNIILLVFLGASISFASTIDYLQELTNKPRAELIQAHKEIKYKSKKLHFLKCPAKLIENQYNGPESVIMGIEIFEDLINESYQIDPDYENIHDNCLDILDEYVRLENLEEIKRKELSAQEYGVIASSNFLKNTPKLAELILASINAETLCHSSRIAVSAHVVLGLSMGVYQMDCYTPLGRRFTLRGPALGMGFGGGISLALPNHKEFTNSLAHGLYIYKRQKYDHWTMSNLTTTFAWVFGAAIENDRSIIKPKTASHMIYEKDFRPAVGLISSFEQTFQVMTKKQKKPYYAKLILTELFDEMANTAL